MNNLISIPFEKWDADADKQIEQLIREYDETCMPLPAMESEPHILISKVRKHYMEYLIQLLSVNYENNQQLVNKNIYLPSAIWRCAKNIELSAARSSMVVQIYRKHIVSVIKELKKDNKTSKLNKNLYECLHKPPVNEKKMQTTFTNIDACNCQCTCNLKKKKKRVETLNKLEVIDSSTKQISNIVPITFKSIEDMSNMSKNVLEPSQTHIPSIRMSIESQESVESKTQREDDLMLQLEKLFQGDSCDDDLFEGTLYSALDLNPNNEVTKATANINNQSVPVCDSELPPSRTDVIESHAAQIKSLDEKLASLAGMLVTGNETSIQKPVQNIESKRSSSKWICEEYFLKTKLFEMMDQIRDQNRRKHDRIKLMLIQLFGEDSDDEGVVSPLEETSSFVLSCKERIAPWVVKLLTPYYVKGRIRGKALFKSLAKHLIRLIYQCSKYPEQCEVTSFVSDFLANHKMIRSEADFKEFRIKNF